MDVHLTETISRSSERSSGSQGKHGQEWPRCAPVLWRPLYSIYGSQHLLHGLYCSIMHVSHFVRVKTSEQSVAASGLLYEAMGMTLSDPSHTQAHISKCRQISHAFFLPFRLLLLLLLCLLFFPLVSFVTGKVLIALFPKLFLIKDKQGIYISLGDVGLPKVPCSFLQFSLCSRGRRWMIEMQPQQCARWLCFIKGGVGPAGV